jgi:UDP-3-O-[3-hydroxymyristoyl] glucosamine N-acyltransferase
VVIVPPKWADEATLGMARIVARSPRACFARLAVSLVEERHMHPGPALQASDVRIEDSAVIEPGVVLGPGVSIGRGSRIGANSVIGPGVAIGRDTILGAGVKVRFSLIGDGVRIFAGSVLGEAGFGVAGDADGLVDVPHMGRVIIMDRVSLGAHVTVDRGMFGDTVIGEETKLDNHCHIAHNAVVGRRVRMAAYSGIAGSTTVEDGATFGGRVGIADHLRMGVGSTLAAGSLVMHDVPDGETWGGYPAKPIRRWMREVAWLQRAIGKREGRDDT